MSLSATASATITTMIFVMHRYEKHFSQFLHGCVSSLPCSPIEARRALPSRLSVLRPRARFGVWVFLTRGLQRELLENFFGSMFLPSLLLPSMSVPSMCVCVCFGLVFMCVIISKPRMSSSIMISTHTHHASTKTTSESATARSQSTRETSNVETN